MKDTGGVITIRSDRAKWVNRNVVFDDIYSARVVSFAYRVKRGREV